MRFISRSLLVVVGLLAALPGWAEVTARVDRDTLSEGQAVRLILELTGQEAGGEPDLSVLRDDFHILGTARSTQVRVVNGRTRSRTDWTVTLTPRSAGQLTIPALRVGNATSRAITILVKAAPESAPADTGRYVFMETEVDEPSPYLQAQVMYTVRLHHAVDLSGSLLTEPQTGNAVIRRLGEDIRYQTRHDGRVYGVLERRYAVFPQSAGPLAISSPRFTGRVPGGSRRQGSANGFGTFDRFYQPTRNVERHGPDVGLDVRMPPRSAQGGEWLPAKHVAVSESWSPDPPEFRVGEPVTRSVTVMVWGADEGKVPAPSTALDPSFKVYPEKEIRDSRAQGTNLVGRRVQAVTLVPTRQGRFTLPEVQVRWWDTARNREQVSVLPAQTVKVLPELAGGARSAKAQSSISPTPAPRGAPSEDGGVSMDAPGSEGARYWPWLLAAGLLGAWLVTLWLWRRERRGVPKVAGAGELAPAVGESPHELSARAARHALESACREDETRGARDALLAWARAAWHEHPPVTLVELADRITEPRAHGAIQDLDRIIYARSEGEWRGEWFWRVVSPVLKKPAHVHKGEEHGLPGLTPHV